MSIIPRTFIRRSALASPRQTFAPRTLHQTALRSAYKDDQDRESLKPKAHEYTASGTDEDTAASHGDAAFNPEKTSPEAAKQSAAEGAKQQGKDSPLQNSPADKEFAEAGQGKEEDRPHAAQRKKSGGSSAPKAGKV
ncbi:hypothetical protein GGR57DRAFT_452715 [Xylariaceae sp. FL1272]|nr:hypothetical protein GGR57DRAFT_452715 [Xylariaceae sp. FL1272]